ncbi:ribonuclease H-like domain-containing protein [Tanacetum coccineum]
MNVNNAYLYGDLKEEVYMLPLHGFFKNGEIKVCKLVKSLYGLKQAPRQWNQKLSEALLEAGNNNDEIEKPVMTPLPENLVLSHKETDVDKNLASWKSKRQPTLSKSSAEYRFVASTTCEIMWIVKILSEFSIDNIVLAELFCDNKSAIQIAASPIMHEKTKHFDIDVHLVADILTKALGTYQHSLLVKNIEGCDVVGKAGISALMKCTSAIRQLVYAAVPDSLDEYLQIGEKTSRDCPSKLIVRKTLRFSPRQTWGFPGFDRQHRTVHKWPWDPISKKDVERAFGVTNGKKWAIQSRTPARLGVLKVMKVIAAYLLALLGGNTSPSAEDLKTILGSVGADADEDRIALLLSEVKGKDITELIASGREKLASVPSGGGVAVAAAGGGAAPAAAEAESKKEEKVEEKEESDEEMGFSLFDD